MYHVGLIINKGNAKFQLRRDKDYLSCELYEYYGTTDKTRKQFETDIRANITELSAAIVPKFKRARRLCKTVD